MSLRSTTHVPTYQVEERSLQVTTMETARSLSSFDPSKMAEIIYGSKEAVDKSSAAFDRVEKALGSSDMSKLPACYVDSNREATLLEGFRTGKVIFEDDRDHGNHHFDFSTQIWCLTNSHPFGMTHGFFLPSVTLQGTDEQVAYWKPLAESGKIIGTYVQTELAHGTFVHGVQTTATFDIERDEFIINTPSLEAIKFWPGGVGYSSTHIFLVTRMVIAGKDLGVHSFIVQIRSLDDFKPLPGIELGDVGMKMSFNTIDNGFIIFHGVRIPRTNLLMRYSTVSRDGTYTADPLREKLLYGGMLRGRKMIIKNAAFRLAQALTIATRYSTVRLQGRALSAASTHEPTIISYDHQQHRLMTWISKSYVMLFSSNMASEEYDRLYPAQLKGDHSKLPYVHMLMCGLKAWGTQTTAEGSDHARQMCGGHGYMNISGLGDIVASVSATCTFEGENYVMWGQVGKYLWKGLSRKFLPQDLEYVGAYRGGLANKSCDAMGDDFLSLPLLVEIFQHRAARLAVHAHKLVSEAVANGAAPLMAENKHSLHLFAAGRAHIELYILTSSITVLQRLHIDHASAPPEIVGVLTSLVTLFALSTIGSPFSTSSATFLEDGFISSTQLACIREQMDLLVEDLAPDAIALTDSWNFSDASMASAIGCRDGDIYRRVMSWVKQLQINVDAAKNDHIIKGSWENYVEPMLKSKLMIKSKL